MRILIDTNIILRLTQPENPVHADIVAVVTLLRQESVELCIVPQNLYEFWVVATRPIPSNGLGMSSQSVKQSLDFLLIDFVLLRDERGIYNQWIDLVTQFDVKGRNAHDARLVAAMQRHNLKFLLTFNTPDFARYPFIETFTPRDVVTGKGPKFN